MCLEVQASWSFENVLDHILSIEGLPSRVEYRILKSQIHNGDEEALKRPGMNWPKEVRHSLLSRYFGTCKCMFFNVAHRLQLIGASCCTQVSLCMPTLDIMRMFQARDIIFHLSLNEVHAPEAGTSALRSPPVVNAFSLMQEGSRRMSGGANKSPSASERLPPPAYQLMNSKIQLEIDVHEVFDSLGLESPPSQHEYLKRSLKNVVNFLWYIDPYHHLLRGRHGHLPLELEHIAENSYNNYREKKQKPPPLKAETLEAHANELFSVLATPSMKLACNARALSVISELAHMAALQVSQMRKHAAGMRLRRELNLFNDGQISISFMEKKIGPYNREIEKALIRELRNLVRVMCEAATAL